MRRAALLAALVLASPSVGMAHGRQPSLGQIAFDPVDPAHVVIRGTWAFLTTRDTAGSFTWTCARAVDFDRTIEDPRIAVLASGRVLAGTFGGLSRSDPAGCAYAPSTDPLVDGLLVIDVASDPFDPSAAWVATSPGAVPNTILHTTDEGASFELRGTFPLGVLLERVVPSPSDRMRVYASGVQLATATEPRHAFVWRSSDGGRTFAPTEIALVDVDRTDYGERNVHVDAVDPTDPDVVYAHTVRRTTDVMDERLLRSEDGGATFTQVAALPEITGLTLDETGTHVWTGSWYGGFYRSDDHGRTFTALDPTLRVRCLSYRPRELWICTDDVTGPFALGRSIDMGVTIDPLWAFQDAVNDVGCPACTQVGDVCPAYWPDVQFDLGLTTATDALPPDPDASSSSCIDGALPDAGTMDAARMDAGVAGAPPAGCACHAATGRGPLLPWLVVLAATFVRRRRRCD